MASNKFDAAFQATFRLAHLVKAIVTSLPLYACVGMSLKLQGEHAVLAAEGLGRLGTVNALEPLRGLTGFFTDSAVREAAKAAIDQIESRHASRGGLSISLNAPGGGLSPAEED